MPEPIEQRFITEENHQQFAELSGDLNPLHVDAKASKLMPPGQRLAYGMYMLLWALESLVAQDALPANLARVRARFTKWVFIGDGLHLSRSTNPSGNTYEVMVGNAVVALFDLYPGDRMQALPIACANVATERRTEPKHLLLHELEDQEALVPVADRLLAASMYPLLTERFGAQWVSECATCSYIIGMEAPGFYSMSMKYDLQFCTEKQNQNCMHYKVVGVDDRFRKIRLAISGTAIQGTLEAMVREAQN